MSISGWRRVKVRAVIYEGRRVRRKSGGMDEKRT
jgi:hypothetical protein